MSDPTATALAQAAQAVEEAAREQKRAASFHRRRTRELFQRLDALERVCAQHGIRLEINTKPEGGHGVRAEEAR